MEKIEQPENIMGISLLHKCNFNCDHCGYIYVGDADDHIIKPGYKLTWAQVMTAISDCLSFKGLLWNINFTGGEPTLWEENGHRFLDMLLEVDKAGIMEKAECQAFQCLLFRWSLSMWPSSRRTTRLAWAAMYSS